MSKNTINPEANYWASFNRFELRLPGEAVIECSHSGDCNADVARWAPRIREQANIDNFKNRPTPESIRLELKEYGSWEDLETVSEETLWERLTWIAAGNILDEETPDCSEPVQP